mmetsp:Transcript_41313/g.106937  ORF Transcript_41313/g.106937 Transcript_41313/m.106937 type:complete len:258 (-) Transcript_41313:1533-2306(-)
MSKVIIKGHLYSQPTRAVVWACKLLGIPHEFKFVDLAKGENRSEEFIKTYDFGRIPVISHGNFNLQESHAILRYLCEAFKPEGSTLYPSDLQQRAKIDEFLDYHHLNLRASAGPFVRLLVFGPLAQAGASPKLSNGTSNEVRKKVEAEAKEKAKEQEIILRRCSSGLSDILHTMDRRLSQAPYLAGTGQPTLADISAFCELRQLMLMPFSPSPVSFPNVAKWINTLAATSEAQEVEGPLVRLLDKIPRPANNPLSKL